VPDQPPPTPTFEAALAELEQVVKELEGGDMPLERSLQLFERGMELSELCRNMLDHAEQRVEILTRRREKLEPQPFQPPKS
jgi:exodeoxyribonuclease VII small subunit